MAGKFVSKAMSELFNRLRWSELLRPSLNSTPSPVIMTPWGAVTESARRQCALNMREDPILRVHIEGMVGSEAETRRRYPEAYL